MRRGYNIFIKEKLRVGVETLVICTVKNVSSAKAHKILSYDSLHMHYKKMYFLECSKGQHHVFGYVFTKPRTRGRGLKGVIQIYK